VSNGKAYDLDFEVIIGGSSVWSQALSFKIGPALNRSRVEHRAEGGLVEGARAVRVVKARQAGRNATRIG
jgi:hypothetical protein